MDETGILKKLKDLDYRVLDLEHKLQETSRQADQAAADAANTRRRLDELASAMRRLR